MLVCYTFTITIILHCAIVGIYIRELLSTLSGQIHWETQAEKTANLASHSVTESQYE